jgi:selenocysteine-specific elongation factor
MSDPKTFVIGTAGHIDHGKTTLVRALTGTDTDRLEEEKRRGITIVLGFAALELPGGLRAGVVDVPGHEKFVRTMVAGAGGIDVGLLVVSADEGVMPQTREHMEILSMLHVPELVVALTRADLVDEELMELAELDVSELLADSRWPDAPVFGVSGLTGQGIDALKTELAAAGARLPARHHDDPLFRMPVDRSFTIRGFGTVVTGTTRDGAIHAGDTLEVLPGRVPVKVRGIQSHGEAVGLVGRGTRVALNLQGVEPATVPAGCWLATPRALASSDRLNVAFDLLESAPWPLANNARVRLLYGTDERIATVRLIDAEGGPAPDEVEIGASALAQLALDEPIGAVAGDRFVLRAESPMRTLGGGRVLDPDPVLLRRRGRSATAALLAVLGDPDSTPSDRAVALLERTPGDALDLHALRRRLPLGTDAKAAAADPRLVPVPSDPPAWVAASVVDRWRPRLAEAVAAHHVDHPLLDGPQLNELRQAITPPPTSKVFEALLPVALDGSDLERRGPRVAHTDHAPEPDAAARRSLDEVVARLAAGGAHPPKLAEALEGLTLPADAMAWLVDRGEVVRVAEDWIVAREPFRALFRKLVAHIDAESVLTPGAFKDISGLTRRGAIPFLEYLDRARLTQRHPDGRVLRERPEWL